MAGAPNLDGLGTLFWILAYLAIVGVAAIIYGVVWLVLHINITIH